MPRYAILCGSAPSGFTQKKINEMHDFLTGEAGGSWAEKEIVFFPNDLDDAMLAFVLERQKSSASRLITINDSDYDELYNFVGQVDMLMTDYSSIYFDFIATKKPVVLLPFDYDFYIKYARGHYFNYFENMEGAKAKNWKEFYRILEEKSYSPVSEETLKKFAEYLDGNIPFYRIEDICKKCYFY